jgi:hypothetical protein
VAASLHIFARLSARSLACQAARVKISSRRCSNSVSGRSSSAGRNSPRLRASAIRRFAASRRWRNQRSYSVIFRLTRRTKSVRKPEEASDDGFHKQAPGEAADNRSASSLDIGWSSAERYCFSPGPKRILYKTFALESTRQITIWAVRNQDSIEIQAALGGRLASAYSWHTVSAVLLRCFRSPLQLRNPSFNIF